MTGLNVLENKVAYIQKYLAKAERYLTYSQKQIEESDDLRGAVERYLYLLAESCISLAEAIVSFQNLRKPSYAQEAFDILAEEKILPKGFTNEFGRIVGFRNALAHDYEELDFSIVYDVLHTKLDAIRQFLRYVQDRFNLQ